MQSLARETADPGAKRWGKLLACVVAMMAIANLQYAWTYFTTPLTQNLHTTLANVQWAFSFFAFTQTALAPFYAYLIDRYGARIIVAIASLFVGASWVGAGLVTSLTGLYIAYACAGVGAGIVYSACVSVALKWFPDRRGLCVGAVAGSFGFGTALTVLPVTTMIGTRGYAATFITWGIIQGVVVLLASPFLTLPPSGWQPAGWEQLKAKLKSKVQQSTRDYTPQEMLRTTPFYVLYFMMTIVAAGGLMVAAQVGAIGTSYGFNKHVLFGTITVLSLSGSTGQVLNGLARPFWGWVSDHIGRYNTMGIAFSCGAAGLAAFALLIAHPIWFIVLSSLTFLAWGEIYSLFPAAVADIFGSRYATTNYAIQYTSKGVASILAGPGAAMLVAMTGSWTPVFWAAVACDLVAAVLALFWLKPLVTQLINQRASTPKEEEQKAAARAVEKEGQATAPSIS